MARQRDPRRDEAFELFKRNNGDITNRAIAEELDVPEKTISAWKSRDKWNAVLQNDECSTTEEKRSTAKRGAPKGNRNATGNKGGGAPKGNQNALGHGAPIGNQNSVGHGAPARNDNAVTHGFFRRHLPPAAMEIIEQMGESNLSILDLLWMSIEAKFAAIMHSQKIMFVESKEELIKELKKSKYEVVPKDEGGFEQVTTEEEYEFQWAWERQANFLTAQARAMAELRNLIKDYMLHSGEDDKRRLEIEKMQNDIEKAKLEIDKLSNGDKDKPIEILIKSKKKSDES